ncbi:MAG: PKD domain-containing protein [bacterium]|nr:PKD domain-containing protein [bacterium]
MLELLRRIASAISVVFFALFLTGCPDSTVGPDPLAGKIEVGPRSNTASFDVGASGGTVTITEGDITGARIAIPAGAYTSVRSLRISTAPVTKHTFSADFNVLTPLIRLDNGGGYADQPMQVTVPITLPVGHFAMAFFYDEETGELEGVPALSLTDTTITIVTAHLSGRHLSDGAKGGILSSKTYVDVIIASIDKHELDGTQSTSFTPGIDDWEFANYGSYIAPKGHCAGQSVSAMWYFSMKKGRDLQPALNGNFDLVHGAMWEDNPRGYRFASVVQDMLDWDKRDGWLTTFENTGTTKFTHDSLHYLSFCYGIRMTSKPQYIGIRSASGGHAMIAYKAGGGKIWVCDPNYPGNAAREILMQPNGTFAPYTSGANANDLGTPYPHINYVAKSSLISHEGIDAEWEKVKNGTIGSGKFPAWELWLKDPESGIYAKYDRDTLFAAPDGKLEFEVRCASCEYGFDLPRSLQDAMLITPDYQLKARARAGKFSLALKEGSSLFAGLYVMAQVGTSPETDSTYLDFRWLTLVRSGLTITPADTSVELNDKVVFTAHSNGTAPAQARYTWYFDDLDDPIIVDGDSTIEHTFEQEGRFAVGVILSNRATGKDIDTAETWATVGALAQKIFIQIGDYTFPADQVDKGPIVMSDGSRLNHLTYINSIGGLTTPCEPLVWNGNSFSATISCDDDLTSYMFRVRGSVSGTLSQDRKTLKTLTISHSKTVQFTGQEPLLAAEQSITIKNLPLEYIYGALSGLGAKIKGTSAAQYVTSITYTILVASGGTETRSLTSVDWASGETQLWLLLMKD